MGNYVVFIPVTGYIEHTVKGARSKKDAIRRAEEETGGDWCDAKSEVLEPTITGFDGTPSFVMTEVKAVKEN